MKKTTIAMIALMLTTMTACEKASMDEDSGSGQVTNALLQVRTRGGDGLGYDKNGGNQGNAWSRGSSGWGDEEEW